MQRPLPDITAVDFTAPAAVILLATRLSEAAAQLSMAEQGSRPTRESAALRQTAARAFRRLDDAIPRMTVADAFNCTGAYDLLHRFGYSTGADPDALRHYTLRAFESMIRGDRTVDQYAMYRAIRQAVRRRDTAYLDRPLQWLLIVEERWYLEARNGFPADLPEADIAARIRILLDADLMPYEGRNQSAFKQQLSRRYSSLLTAQAG